MKISKQFKNDEAKRLYVACRTHGVKLGESVPFGKDSFIVELSLSDAGKLFDVGQLFASVTGNEYDAADAKKAAAKAAAEKAKK